MSQLTLNRSQAVASIIIRDVFVWLFVDEGVHISRWHQNKSAYSNVMPMILDKQFTRDTKEKETFFQLFPSHLFSMQSN